MNGFELTTLAEDDQLLDALGRGETPNRDDPVAALLGDWRAALPETCPVEERPERPAQRTRRRGQFVVAAAVALVAAGGVSAAAEHAEPDSPLWPVTQLLYGDLADSRAAGQAAREAVTVAVEATENGRYDRATELLDQAAILVEQVDEPGAARQLRSRIATVRAQIATATAGVTEGGGSERGVSDGGVTDGGVSGGITEGIPETSGSPSGNVPSPNSAPPAPAVTTEPGGDNSDNGDDNSDDNGDDNSGGGNGGNRNRPGNSQSPAVPDLPTVPAPSGPAAGSGK